ncbi:LysR family transcriptional regulator [Paraburkholderia haematera]|uniref:HTH-type transcriptional regulator YahB n=1 Tax=Paraburkholderia haematera TaxID=2793077 RepID=A0ABN7MMP2_9BURK|nr:LysR family transcriptional regulator [Paraburkholderia haematera]CAE6809239.1 putative HTH-type transcriptional regulator YahB [Paraburkholderia haematera]
MKHETANSQHLKVFTTVVETGSFSRAATQLDCTQSVVSYTIASLESYLGVSLFERTRRRPVLTQVGRAILAEARNIEMKMLDLRARTSEFKLGVETELSVVVDVMFPSAHLTDVLVRFARSFPNVALNIRIEALGGVLQMILDKSCEIGVSGVIHPWPDTVEVAILGSAELVPVASPRHPLANVTGTVSMSELRNHTQLVLSDRCAITKNQDFGVYATHTWRIADLTTKHDLLRTGFGWGTMPRDKVSKDLETGALVILNLGSMRSISYALHMVTRIEEAHGPAADWLAKELAIPE